MLNRRRFLGSAAAFLAAMSTGCANAAPLPRAATTSPEPFSLPADGTPSPSLTPARPMRVALLSDIHLQPEDSGLAKTINLKFAKAVEDFRPMEPDLWITNGDVADHGISSELEAFKKIIAKAAPLHRVLATTGNHEFYDMETTDDVSLSRWRQAFGVEKPYTSRVAGDLHFVLLADEQWKTAPYNPDWCWITPEQITWFERVLAEHRDKFTVVFMHQPLNETVVGSMGARAFGGTNMAEQIYAILAKNPQVKLWFSGHTHRRVDVDGQVVEKNGVTFMGLGSTIYLLGPRPGGGSGRDTEASQSRMLEIYPDRVRILARDHVAGQWMDALERTVKRS
ncbi:MAG TPA: metallophosphoesterase [Symbiobacteriaceae bacterium]|nr:metallophosphoesterase [Symbiobacteriaceae bacterium]